MGFVKGLFMAVIFFYFTTKIYKAIVILKPGKTIFEHKPGPCYTIPEATEGSEDMTRLPSGQVLITAGLRFRTNNLQHHKGKILLFDFNKPTMAEELEIVWKDEERFFQDFNPHGIDVFTTDDGKHIVFVVNHNPHEAIERFELNLKTKQLKHLETIQDSTMRLMNSVVAIAERSFFFTNYLYRREGLLSELEYMMSRKQGSVGSYDGTQSKGIIAAHGYSLPNGIALSNDRTKLYLANIGELSIDTFQIHSISNITLEHTYNIDTIVDNIQVDANDGSLWLGCHPSGWLSRSYLKKPVGLTAPSQVLKVKVDSDGYPLDNVTEVYSNRGQEISASSVALRHHNAVLIGSVCQNMVYCEIRNED